MFPTPWTITVHAHSYGAKNGHGARADVFTDRVERVYGWSPPSADTEPFEQGRRVVVADLDIYGPATLSVDSLDEVTIPSGAAAGRYKVEGDPEDFNHGPFGFAPGVRVSLRRVEEKG